jgi:hypothetical protein
MNMILNLSFSYKVGNFLISLVAFSFSVMTVLLGVGWLVLFFFYFNTADSNSDILLLGVISISQNTGCSELMIN